MSSSTDLNSHYFRPNGLSAFIKKRTGCPEKHHSTAGYCIFSSVPFWSRGHQNNSTLLSQDQALKQSMMLWRTQPECIWLCFLLRELHVGFRSSFCDLPRKEVVHCSNVSAFYLSQSGTSSTNEACGPWHSFCLISNWTAQLWWWREIGKHHTPRALFGWRGLGGILTC